MPDLHIIRIEASNVRRLTLCDVELDPGGGLIRIVGKNKAGKSSLVGALRSALGGGRETPDDMIHDESEDGTGKVTVTLSNAFRIEKNFTEAAPKGRLRIMSPDGGAYKQAKLNDWLGANHEFDVGSFFDETPARQVEIVLSLADDPELKVGIDRARERYQKHYDARTSFNSDIQRCQRTTKPEGERPTAVDVSAELVRLDGLNEYDRVRGAAERDVEREAEAIATAQRALDVATESWEAHAETHAAAVSRLAETPNVSDDIAAVKALIATADDANESLKPWRVYDEAQESLAVSQKEAKRLTNYMKQARETERALFADADIPIDDLSIDPETYALKLNGKSLDVASGGERATLALDIAEAHDPDLKVILIDEGNNMGPEMLATIASTAKARNFQVFMCRLDGPGEIMVVDGVATVGKGGKL